MTELYRTDRSYVRDELARLDCRLRLEVDQFEGPVDEFGSLYVSEAEVERLLSSKSTDGAGRTVRDGRRRLAQHTRRIENRRQATATDESPLRIDRLLDRFGLGDLAREVLIVALAPDADEKYATVYAYLQDDATRRRPTVGFVLGLLAPEADQLADRSLFTPGSPLVDDDLIRLSGDGPLPTRTVRTDRRIVQYLLGEDGIDPAISDIVSLRTPADGIDTLAYDSAERQALRGIADPDATTAARERTVPPLVAIYGPAGTGKADRVAAITAERGRELLRVDCARIGPDRLAERLDRIRREAALWNADILLDGILDGDGVAAVAVDRLESLDTALFLTGESEPPTPLRKRTTRHEFVPLSVERAAHDDRRRYWEEHCDRPADVDPAAIASTFRLSRGAIDDALEMAAGTARAAGEPVTAGHVYRACREQSSEELSELATRIDPGYGWDDIVLPDETESRLREVASRLTDRGTVYTDWGFANRSSLGNGLIAMFSGPSGTGKTMAAEVVANHAGLHLYKIDLAAVVSKYVGETESNLGRIFDEAADSDAVLLFDEADALFGKRSEVSDAHDRYATVEVDYLLQRVEEHDGAVLLTTNLESNIDDAFMRRIHLGVDFPLPDRSARRAIWRGVFPPETPVDNLDYDFLARLEFTGGNIRNIALTAAFYAANDGTAVGMEPVVRAIRRECQKTGMRLPLDELGQYSELLDST